jgi:alpha-mannosidase
VNHPLEAFVVTDPKVLSGSKPEDASYVEVKPDNIVVSCVKLAEDSEDCVVRMYDATGKGAEAEILFGFRIQEAHEVDMLERTLNVLSPEGNKLAVPLRPCEIKTVRVKRG